jgi:hypothetical protein
MEYIEPIGYFVCGAVLMGTFVYYKLSKKKPPVEPPKT